MEAEVPGTSDERDAAERATRFWVLIYHRRPWTLNIERAGNRWKRAALVKEWRAAFCALAQQEGIPKLEKIAVHVHPAIRNRAGEPDTGACIGAAKAAIDGVVDAGVLPHDGPLHVRSLVFHAPVVSPNKTDSLTIVIEEVKDA